MDCCSLGKPEIPFRFANEKVRIGKHQLIVLIQQTAHVVRVIVGHERSGELGEWSDYDYTSDPGPVPVRVLGGFADPWAFCDAPP